jgi:Flp pilus assembly protein TadG
MNTRSTADATGSRAVTKRIRPERSGNIAVLSLFLLVVMLSLVALAVDVGYLQCASTESQRSADAAAIAATWKLLDQMGPNTNVTSATLATVQSTASQYAGANHVANAGPALASGDVDIGQLGPPYNHTVPLTHGTPNQYNAVTVNVRRTASDNGEVSLFFAKVMGRDHGAVQSQATAAFLNNVAGFQTPGDGQHDAMILPFALDQQTWDSLATAGTDSYKYDPATHTVSSGTDNIKEVNLYPQGTGAPGNRGTVKIGVSNNSTAILSAQIRNGITPAQMAFLGGKLELDPHTHTLQLGGNPGISAGVKDDLAAIIGQPRCIPIFSSVSGPGNNAVYTIVKFVGVRIVYVNLTGNPSNKKVLIQPASMTCRGVVPGTGTATSEYIYSPVWLVK